MRAVFPALVRRGCPRAARAGAVCSKTKVPINNDEIRSALRSSIRTLRDVEQTTPPLRGCPSLLRRGLAMLPSALLWRENSVRKTKSSVSEAQSHLERDDTFAAGARDPAEIEGIDIRFGIAELRVIQEIDSVAANFEVFALGNPNSLNQVYIKTKRSRPLEVRR